LSAKKPPGARSAADKHKVKVVHHAQPATATAPAQPRREKSFKSKHKSKTNSKFLVGGRGPRYIVVSGLGSHTQPGADADRPDDAKTGFERGSALEQLWQVEAELKSALKIRAQYARAASPKSAAEHARDAATDQRVLGRMREQLSEMPGAPDVAPTRPPGSAPVSYRRLVLPPVARGASAASGGKARAAPAMALVSQSAPSSPQLATRNL
jgi:hypothetical protein